MDDTRRYTDAEVRALLERAARLQGQPRRVARSQGLTLAQLEEIATEAQIDVATLHQAARELAAEHATRPRTTVAKLAGAPLRIVVEHTLPFEVDDDALGMLAGSISASSGDIGDARVLGRTLTWHAPTYAGRRLDVRVSVHGGATHIRLEERYGELAGGLFGGVIGGVGGGVGFGAGSALASALGSTAVLAVFPVAVVGVSYAACRMGFAAYVRHRRREVNALCERIVQELKAAQRPNTA